MSATQHFIQPVDVLFLRGNKLFGDPGSFGESHVPPWPSVAAGALRSALLVHKGIDPVQFARGQQAVPELGTPQEPGPFTLTAFHLARLKGTPEGKSIDLNSIEPLFQVPADLFIRKSGNDNKPDGTLQAQTLRPCRLSAGIHCSNATPLLPVLPEQERGKPAPGFWLNTEGWKKHLAGETIDPDEHLVCRSHLWKMDMRVGVGLDGERRRALDGALFSTQGVVMRQNGHCGEKRCREPQGDTGFAVGFLAETVGAGFPEEFPLRLGGDGRAAIAHRVQFSFPQPDYEETCRNRRCRLILTSPGIFPQGWLPAGTTRLDTGLQFDLHGVRGKLVCAAVPRALVVSGFDIARWAPKPAQRAVPCGSVYWLQDLEATPEALSRLVRKGLWADQEEDSTRRAEGYNRLTLASYPTE